MPDFFIKLKLMFVNQKSQEISLALIKLAIYIRRKEFRQRIESLAFQLLEDTASRNLEDALITIDVLEDLITFGKAIYEIEPINAKILLQELETLNSAIRQSTIISKDISDVFSKVPAIKEEVAEANGNSNGNGNGISSTIRQSAIIEKIRQTGNTAMRDLLAAFPEVSERTLRYDLQKLCNQGIVDRIGNGGPSSHYAIRNKITEDSL